MTLDPDGWCYGLADDPDSGEVLRLAQNLARNVGYAVFPCRDDKRPACPHGFKDAGKDEAAIADLWRRYPGPLIGVATGTASDLAVLDIDLKHDEARAWWRQHESRFPLTRAYRTRSGGVHLFFRYTAGVKCTSARPVPGIDVRGDGGYVIHWFAGGLHCLAHEPRAPWPEWLTATIWPPTPAARPSSAPRFRGSDAAIEGLLRVIRDAGEGTRNGRLFWAATRMRERVDAGELQDAEAQRALLEAASAAGLPQIEARRTVASAWRRP